MSWLQLSFDISAEHSELLSEILTEAGAAAVTLRDAKDHPIFEPKPDTNPLWPTTTVIGLFEADCDLGAVKKYLNQQLIDALNPNVAAEMIASLRIEPLEDQNWVQTSLDQFKPQRFGKHLWIIPSWFDNEAAWSTAEPDSFKNTYKTYKEDPHSVTINLDPGLAFGTGTHETTALCLEWLDAHPPINALVIDYGSGSGILGIAALKLGAKQVIAVDYDAQALISTKNNAEKNGLTDSDLITTTPDSDLLQKKSVSKEKADLILANILADPILVLIPTFARLLKPGGDLVLSGILSKQCEPLCQRLQENGFQQFEIELKGDWARINCKLINL